MHGIREFNNKITNLKNTLKITSSMRMVSTVKLQKFTRIKQSVESFSQAVDRAAIVFNNAVNIDTDNKKNCQKPVSKAIIILFASDRGLCGRYNSNVLREAMRLYNKLKSNSIEPSFCCVGQKGYAYLMRCNLPIENFYSGIASNPTINNAEIISDDCLKKFLASKTDEIYIVYTQKKSSQFEETVTEKILPLKIESSSQGQKSNHLANYVITEASPEKCLKKIQEMKTLSSVYKAIIESVVSEHSARMVAMDTASSNCDRMIQHYIQLRNRARQTAITTELNEIVTGKEVLG